jgi:hypothetical protein
MRRLSAIVIPVPVAIAFLCVIAYAGDQLARRATASPLTPQVQALLR